MKRLFRFILALILGTHGQGLNLRQDTPGSSEPGRPLGKALALPMSRSGIYGSYTLLNAEPRQHTSEASARAQRTAQAH